MCALLPSSGKGARWASALDLARAGWMDKTGWPLGDLTAVGPRVYLPGKRQRENVLVMASVGGGKTRGFLAPAILSEAALPAPLLRSLIVVDPVGELFALTGQQLSATHRVLVWNPADPARCTCFFDPLAYVPRQITHPRFIRASDLAAANIWLSATHGGGVGDGKVGQDPYWIKQPANVIKGLIPLLMDDPAPSLTKVVDYLIEPAAGELQTPAERIRGALTSQTNKVLRIRGLVMDALAENKKAEAGVFSDLLERFTILAEDSVLHAMTGGPSLDAATFIDVPTIVYVQVGANNEDYHPLLSVFVATFIDQLRGLVETKTVLPREVRFIVEEWGSLGRMHGLDTAIALLRGYGIGFVLVTQNMDLAASRYGQAVARSIAGTCNTTLCFPGLADADAETISKRLGRALVEESTRGGKRTVERPLMYAAEFHTMSGQLVVSSSQIAPILLKMRLYKG